ncbi:MAG: hypothetical protein ACOZNI_29260 [Myxococcota bacterium]
MFWLVVACAHTQVSSKVEPEDLAEIPPEQLYELRDEEQAQVAARGSLDAAQRDELRAANEVERAEAQVEAAEADVRAAKAEIDAANANRDGVRLDAARRTLILAEQDETVARALVDWKRAALREAEARTAEAEALVDLRLAETEMARVELLGRDGTDEGYVVSEFIQQLAATRETWERARSRTRERAVEAEEARREYERAHAGQAVGTR